MQAQGPLSWVSQSSLDDGLHLSTLRHGYLYGPLLHLALLHLKEAEEKMGKKGRKYCLKSEVQMIFLGLSMFHLPVNYHENGIHFGCIIMTTSRNTEYFFSTNIFVLKQHINKYMSKFRPISIL